MRLKETKSAGAGLERSCQGRVSSWIASATPMEGVELFRAWFAGEAYRATAGLLVLAFGAQVAISLLRVVRSNRATAADWLFTLMAAPTAAVVGTTGLSTTSTDLPVFLLQVLVAYQLLRWLDHRATRERSGSRPSIKTSRWCR